MCGQQTIKLNQFPTENENNIAYTNTSLPVRERTEQRYLRRGI